MATHGPGLVLECLKEGAMANHAARIIDTGRPRLHDRIRRGALVPLPIYAYLAAITDWELRQAAPKIGPIDGVKFWLEHGVTVAENGIPIFDNDISPCLVPGDFPVLSLVYFVLPRRGIRGLRKDSFFEFIKFLAGFGSPPEQILELRDMYHDIYLKASSIV